eukprot:1222524-Pleurochrysis_carterae.AAC.1
MRGSLGAANAEMITFAQFALGARVRKFTSLACSPRLSPQMRAFRDAQCVHGLEGHAEVAHGRDASGVARAAAAAAFSAAMNEALAAAFEAAT